MLNLCAISGRLTRDPSVKQTQNGVSVATFTVAVDRDFKSGGEKEADFINCVAWRSAVEFIGKYFEKGSAITVTGRIQTRTFTDKEGEKRTATEVVVDRSYFGEKKKDMFVEDDVDDGELPFD